jgi:PEGA domain
MIEDGEAAMTGRTLAVALALGMVAGVARADQAKPRGGGGGGGSSSAGVHHHSSSGGSSPHASGGSGSGGRYSSGGHSTAEMRHPRAGTGHGAYHPYYYYPGYGYWYGPGYWPSYYYGYWPYYGGGAYFGLGGYYSGGYYGGGYYGGGYYGGDSPHRAYNYSEPAGFRLLVEPEDTRVYVDGHYAGDVDDFDGMFQHLDVAPGRHEITLKKDGYRTHRIKVYAAEGSTAKIRFAMERGSGPDTMEDLAGDRGLGEERRPEARGDDRDDADRYDSRANRDDRPVSREREDAPVDDPRHEAAPPIGLVTDGNAAPGLLTLNVTPTDASVYVDGRFVGSARQTGELELRPGRHRVEVVRPGYRTAERDLTIESGRTQALSLDLARP